MTEQHLIEEISRRYKAMSRRTRTSKIRKLACESSWDEQFIRKTFPDLYQEAFKKPRRRAAGARSGSARPQKRVAKRR